MLAWGEDCRRGFRLMDSGDDGVQLLHVSFHIADLSAGRGALAFAKTNGNAFVMRTSDGENGARMRGKQSEPGSPSYYRLQSLELICC